MAEAGDRIKKFDSKRDRIDLSTLLRRANLTAHAIVVMQQDNHTQLHIQGATENGSDSVLLATLENTAMDTLQPQTFIV